MAFRTVIIDSHCKLEYSLNYLIHRTNDNTAKVLLDEIQTIIVCSTAVSITTSLLCEIVKRKIKIIFCDEKSNPSSELSPFYNAHNTSGRIFEQIDWDEKKKGFLWKCIVSEKISNQAKSLRRKNKIEEAELLLEYSRNVLDQDISNREGHAAKVYFNSIYFKGFTRDDDSKINAVLNYGYTLILSTFNRCITSAGYLTQIGIHHKNEYNQFNFACDLMEPFRFVIDDIAEETAKEDMWKDKLISLLGKEFIIDNKKQSLSNAINIYCLSVFQALRENDFSLIKFLKNDL